MAKYLNSLDAHVIAFGRKPKLDAEASQYISAYYSKEMFSEFLRNCDYFINVLPSTDETEGFLNGNILESCKGSHKFSIVKYTK